MTDLTLKIDIPHYQNYLQEDKLYRMCETLIDGYLRAAGRRRNKLYRFLIKI